MTNNGSIVMALVFCFSWEIYGSHWNEIVSSVYLLPGEPDSIWCSCVQPQFICESMDQGAASSEWNDGILIATAIKKFD